MQIHIDARRPKAEITAALLALASKTGRPLSKAKADKLADRLKRGYFDPELARAIQYSDITGEIACGFRSNPFAD